MFKRKDRATFLFMAALTLGLVASTFWNTVAGQAFISLTSYAQWSEVLETTIYLTICSVLTMMPGAIAIKQLRRNSLRHRYRIDFLFLALCIVLAALTIYHSDDVYIYGKVYNKFYFDLHNYFELATSPSSWLSSVVEALNCVNWLWTRLLFFCLLTISVFLILPFWRKAHKNGQKRWIVLILCLGLLLTLMADNLETLYNFYGLYFPVNGYDLIWFLYDAAPFLGLSTLVLAMLTREQGGPLSRKIWWVGLVITSILSLDMVAMVFELRDILANVIQFDANIYFIPMHFWPATPIATMSALSITILSMIVALIMEQRSRKIIAPSIQTNPQADPSEAEEEIEDLESFEVEITDL